MGILIIILIIINSALKKDNKSIKNKVFNKVIIIIRKINGNSKVKLLEQFWSRIEAKN